MCISCDESLLLSDGQAETASNVTMKNIYEELYFKFFDFLLDKELNTE